MTTYKQEVAFYEDKVDELRRGQLGIIQSAAAKWATLTTALLGVFGTVAFAGGLQTIDELKAPVNDVVRIMTTVAAVTAVLGIWNLTLAAGGLTLTNFAVLNGSVLLNHTEAMVPVARKRLTVGRRFAVVTAGLVLAGSLIVLWAPPEPAVPPNLLIRFEDQVVCGRPVNMGDTTEVANRDLAEAIDIIPVSACPSQG